MRILLIYGTTEGQSRKISNFITEQLEAVGHDVECLDSRRKMDGLQISSFDAAIIVGSVHQKLHQEALCNFAIAHRSELQKISTLLFSVSLSAAFSNGKAEAQSYIDLFVDRTGFNPNSYALVAGALRYSEYDYFMAQVVEHVVLASHENITEDREFTNWQQLEIDIDNFMETIVERA